MSIIKKIAQPIGRADVEFYESVHVMAMARIISRSSDEQWEAMSDKARINWLNKGARIVTEYLNTKAVVERLPLTLKTMQARNG